MFVYFLKLYCTYTDICDLCSRIEETKTRFKEIKDILDSAAHDDDDTSTKKNDRMKPKAFCKALEFLLERINLMRIDDVNKIIRRIAPFIKVNGIEYERENFQASSKQKSLPFLILYAHHYHFL